MRNDFSQIIGGSTGYQSHVFQAQKANVSTFSKEELYEIAFAAFMISDYLYALEVSKECKKRFPHDKAIYDIDILCQGERGKFFEVLEICEKKNLQSLVSYIVKGNIYMYSGNIPEALKIFQEGLQEYEDNFVILYNIGNSYYTLGDYKKSQEYYNASIKKGEYLYAYCKVLKILKLLGKQQEFSVLYDHIYNILQTQDIWDHNLIRGNIYYEKKLYKQALKEYQSYLQLRPQDFYTLNAIGNCYYHILNFQQAEVSFKTALEGNQKLFYSYNSLARCYLKQNDIERATSACQKSISLNTYNFTAYFLLGKCYYKKEDFKNAFIYYNKAHSCNVGHHMCNRYISKLEKILGVNK